MKEAAIAKIQAQQKAIQDAKDREEKKHREAAEAAYQAQQAQILAQKKAELAAKQAHEE